MSILIRGMEMPKTGEYRCVIRKWQQGSAITIDLYGEEELSGTIVPVPSHGRLIDADALCEGRVSNDNVVICAKCAPTILEAEEGE